MKNTQRVTNRLFLVLIFKILNELKGIETWLSVFPSGLQIEHSKIDEPETDGIFVFPIKSLVYCGALKLTHSEKVMGSDLNWKFLPLDSEAACDSRNLKNPPIFVAIVKGVDPSHLGENIECHVFVVGMKKSAMKLVESCQKAYNESNRSVTSFRNKYGHVPAVFKSSESFKDLAIIKKHDEKGFFYVINDSAIDLWQLYETNNISDDYSIVNRKARSPNIEKSDSSILKATIVENGIIDPYQDAPNLVKVEKTVDPETGQNVYVRWLTEEPLEPRIIETERTDTPSPPLPPLIIRESGRTPDPIVVEKIVKKKKPQLIIKEIHVNEPAPPPIKVVEEVITDSNSDVDAKKVYKKLLEQSPHRSHKSRTSRQSRRYTDYASYNNVYHPDYYLHHRSKSKNNYYDFINTDIYAKSKKVHQQPSNYYYNSHYTSKPRSNLAYANNYIPAPAYNHYHYQQPPPQQHYTNIKYVRPEHVGTRHHEINNHRQYYQKQYQEPKKHYRKIIVMDDDDEYIEKKSKKNLRSGNPMSTQQKQYNAYSQFPQMRPQHHQ